MELLGIISGVLLLFSVRNGESAESVDETELNAIQKNVEKPRTLYDYQTRVVAYKDLINPQCLLEILTNEGSIISQKLANFGNKTSNVKPISTTNQLSKREVWRLAGTRISDFCRGFPTYLIQNTLPDTQNSDMQNDLPIVEITSKIRRKRDERRYFVGRVRGQTQSQYLNFGNQDGQPGKAEAESSPDGTKAVVTGTSGMGQAQSQSSPVDCGECLGSGVQDQTLLFGRHSGQIPEKITRPEYPGGPLQPGERYPGGPQGVPGGTQGISGGSHGVPGDYQPGGGGYSPGSGHPGGTRLYYPPGTDRPGAESSSIPGIPGADGTRYRPGEVYPPGIGTPGEADSRYPIRGAQPGGTNWSPGAENGQYSGTGPDSGGHPYQPQTGGPSYGPTGPGYTPGTGGPSGTGYPSGIGRPGQGAPGYPAGEGVSGSQPGSIGTTGGDLTGIGTGYPTSTRPGEGGANYLTPGSRPGESVPGYAPPGATGPGYPSGITYYPPGASRPGDITLQHPSGLLRPGDSVRRPGETGVLPPSGTLLPGQSITGPSGIPRPGEESGGYSPGTFGGKLSGQYESHAGQSGKFSGTFHGTYQASGSGTQIGGQGSAPGYGQDQLHKPGPTGRPGYPDGYIQGQVPPGTVPVYYPGGPSSGYPGYPGVAPGTPGTAPGEQQKPGVSLIPGYEPGYPGGYIPGQLPSRTDTYTTQPLGYPGAPTGYVPGTGGGPGTPGLTQTVPGYSPGPAELQKPGQESGATTRPGYPSGYTSGQGPASAIPGQYPTGPSGSQPGSPAPGISPGYGPGAGELQKPGTGAAPGYGPGYAPGQAPGPSTGYYPGGSPGSPPGYTPGIGGAHPSVLGHPGGYIPGQVPTGPGGGIYPGGATGGYAGAPTGSGSVGPTGAFQPGGYGGIGTGSTAGQFINGQWVPQGNAAVVGPPGQYGPGYQPGTSTYPGQSSTGYQGGVTPTGSTGLGPGGQVYGPGGQVYGPGGQVHGPGGQGYGPGGQGYGPGGQVHGPGGQGYGPGGQVYGPGGQVLGPGGQGYGPGGQSYGPGGQVHGPGGQGYGPGGQAYGPSGPQYGPGGYTGSVPSGSSTTGGTFPGAYPGSQQGLTPGGSYPAGTYSPGAPSGPTTGYPPGATGAGGGIPPGQYVQGSGSGAGTGAIGQWGQTGGGESGVGAGVGGQWGQTGGGETGVGAGVGGQWGQTGATDDADSQVQTSVQQTSNETIANAQAHGKFQGGTSQSQVSGTYSGSGSFSASAGSDDGKRGALTQVAGGKDGAQSSAQGRGGAGQSQAQVTLDSGSGDTLSSAQTSGIQHGTQTQVRASEKGGLADAQANGPGPTSSQAQIGFTPYDEHEADNQTTPFRGGGTAAAQSGTLSGMTQTQIQGKFRYGIRYQGAAQAGSGSVAIRNLTEPTGYFKPINFTANKISHNKQSQSQQSSVAVPLPANERKLALPPPETLAGSETSREVQKVDPVSQEDPVVVSKPSQSSPPEYEEPEYADEDYNEEASHEQSTEYPEQARSPSRRNLDPPEPYQTVIRQQKKPSIVTQSSDSQKQHIVLDPLEDLDATVHQSKGSFPEDGAILQPGQVIPGSPGYQIPAGFRGRVKAIANGPNTYAIGKNAQAQSVTLSPGTGRIVYNKSSNPVYGVVTRTTYKNGNYGSGYSYQPIYHPVGYRVKSGKVLPNFVSVSKSEAGSTNPNTGKKIPDIYYTQSSSCGMFTNSCVYANGKKTCFPVRKTNPDGSPMSC